MSIVQQKVVINAQQQLIRHDNGIQVFVLTVDALVYVFTFCFRIDVIVETWKIGAGCIDGTTEGFYVNTS